MQFLLGTSRLTTYISEWGWTKNLDLNFTALAGAQMMQVPSAWQESFHPHTEKSHPVTSKWLTCTLGLQYARHHVSILNDKGAQGCKAQGLEPAADLHPRCTSLRTTTGCHSSGFSIRTAYLVVLDAGAHKGLVDTMHLKAYLVLRETAV